MGEGDRGIGVPVLAVGEGITVADGVEGALVVIGIGVLLWGRGVTVGLLGPDISSCLQEHSTIRINTLGKHLFIRSSR